jgi:type IV pilus assembly protein PilB
VPKAFDKGFRWVTSPAVQAAADQETTKQQLQQEKPAETEAESKKGPVQATGPTDKGNVSAWRPAKSEPVINFVDSLIATAVNDGASDIHIEPREKELHVRLRIDGVLFAKPAPPIKMHPAVISRLKILANLDISERRLPQDGRIRANVGGKQVDLRISMLPISHGEKCVIRVLDKRAISVGLEQLGMAQTTLEAFRSEILQPHGIVLVTGPTGSGKSTTLYSALQVMDGSQLNICTVEDPVEYDLASVNQVQVHESIGMTFAAALRSLLRQDPDTIMVGEIRDEETARVAVQAALTGHMVLSTLHTNDAPSSITRLVDIGIESYLISAAVNGALAQRLLRRICENCKEELTTIPGATAAYLDKHNAEPGTLYCGTGCEICHHTGYKGRIGIYELLVLNQELRDIITRSPSLGDLKAAANAQGMRSLRDDGLAKAFAGQTTVDELIRITES